MKCLGLKTFHHMLVEWRMLINKVLQNYPERFIHSLSTVLWLCMTYLSTPMAVRVKTDTYTVTGWMRYTR